MFELFDQLFVNAKHVVVGTLPENWRWVASPLISAAAILGAFASLFAITVLVERKGLGRIQNRPGPNRVGPLGLLQPMADFVKMLTKEDIVPAKADKLIHFLAPVVMLAPVLLAYSVLPFGRNMVAVDFDAGLLFFFAAGACVELAVFMAGWSSHNKFSLLGGMRAIAQMISYELPLILSALTVVMMAGSLSLGDIVDSQAGHHWGWLARWWVFTPWGLAAFGIFLIAATAESNRAPFDLPEGEAELVAGHLVEYSGFKYAIFFIAEYLGLFAVSALGITLFLGGWRAPVAGLDWLPSWFWFGAKLAGFIVLFIWVRGTLPRVRVDHLMGFAWKFLLPLVLWNVVVTAVWWHTRGWAFTGAGVVRWVACAGMILIPYSLLGRALYTRKGIGPRTYRLAA